MLPKQLADRLNIQSNTIRRWCDTFSPFLSPTASPPKGKPRVLSDLDVRVLHYIAQARALGHTLESITARLDAMRAAQWADLPDVPPDWKSAPETVSVERASERAFDFATIAVLRRDLDYAQQQLDTAQGRVADLESQVTALQGAQTASEGKLHALELDLSQARGEVATLQARLAAYAITGGERPLPVLLIAALVALAVVVLVIALLIVVRLVL